ncbi:hypothetical protein RJ641_022286 [Dillenia turbinata]|uniref:Uncharacterized protein n=1 Tax=Dillenia turbinata TaxID=194707 RepID=A0AAN8UC19_9MAGN
MVLTSPVCLELHESESEDDLFDDGDDDVEEHDNEPEVSVQSEPVVFPGESKNAKKKKKREKAPEEAKDTQDQHSALNISHAPDETAIPKQAEEMGATTVDIKERLKKMSLAEKKKKPTKEMDGAARVAAVEAAARRAKLAAVKKKERNHYNQQPCRHEPGSLSLPPEGWVKLNVDGSVCTGKAILPRDWVSDFLVNLGLRQVKHALGTLSWFIFAVSAVDEVFGGN